jgi:type II secretory pathway pseudopilin PulG
MNKDSPLDMICPACPHGRRAFNRSTGAFTILEVLVGVVLAAGVVSVLVPGLVRQMVLGEQSNHLTAVEAAVSSDLDWFNNYARIWKMKTGSYPDNLATSFSKITMASSYTQAGSATYDPTSAQCASGLADALLADGRSLYLTPGLSSLRSAYKSFFPPNEIKSAPSTTEFAVTSGGVPVTGLKVYRKVETVGNRIRLTYTIQRNQDPLGRLDERSDNLNFVREVSLFVEAAAWCDRLS